MHYDLYHQISAVITMAIVGYVEEIIFRGLLYKAIEKDNVKQAIIISAVTFGAGHIVNLLTDMVDGTIARKTNTVSTFIISGYVCNKRFTVEHTVMNKITGLLLFVLPLTLFFIELKYSAVVVCTIATFSAVQEGHYIRMGREIKWSDSLDGS